MKYDGMIRGKSSSIVSFKWLLFVIVISSINGQESIGDVEVIGVRIDTNDSVIGIGPDGVLVISADKLVTVRLFGQRLDEIDTIYVANFSENACRNVLNEKSSINVTNRKEIEQSSSSTLAFEYHFTNYTQDYCFYYKLRSDDSDFRRSMGDDARQRLRTGAIRLEPTHNYYLPVPVQIIFIIFLLVLSGLFSGLNLGLMSLDKTELAIILKVGEQREREYAEKIYPIRRKGNYLLCSLLLGNVIVNSAISILFDDLTSGMIALIVASMGIVIFGEIVPQAICSRYGLAVGAYTVYITLFFMILTAPLSYPISRLLDVVLGEEAGSVYNKERLLELIRMSKEREGGELSNCQEVQIVTGALELGRKRVRDVMTAIGEVYMLPSETILDPMIVSEIVRSGYTRIPVFDQLDRHNIVAMLNVKDLALLDPEDKIPLTTICKFYQHPVRFVMEDTPLNVMLEEFKKGHYHMAIVQRINNDGEGDPTYQVVGLITMEDILEEIIQAEIMDEFDVIRNNRRPRRAKEVVLTTVSTSKDITMFFYNPDADIVDVSPQLSLATYQYLSTTFEAFRGDTISDQVLQRMIKQNVIRTKPPEPYESSKFLYQRQKECDYFVLILEGKATITVGESELIFEPGPFHHFGYEVLKSMMTQAPRFAAAGSSLDNVAATSTVITPPPADLSVGSTGSTATTTATVVPTSTTNDPRRVATFTPDFSLKVTHELIYLKITSATYLKAFRATLIERLGGIGGQQQPSSPKKREHSTSLSVLNTPAIEMPTLTPLTNVSSVPVGGPSGDDGSAAANGKISPIVEAILDGRQSIAAVRSDGSKRRNSSSPTLKCSTEEDEERQKLLIDGSTNHRGAGGDGAGKINMTIESDSERSSDLFDKV